MMGDHSPTIEPDTFVFILNIDIKDGWYDTIYAFTDKQRANAEADALRERSGDAVFVTAVPLNPELRRPGEAPAGDLQW